MAGSLANKDEAEKCRDLAAKFLQQGEHGKAVRFFEKSLRLYPLPGVESLLDLAKRRQAGPGGGGSAPFSSANGNGSSGSSAGGADASPGVRRRPSATTSAPAPAAAAAAAGGGGGSGRAFTPEQERMVKQVLNSKAKGHYDVLGIEKGANDDQIKKAYRKLALRLHPDKNGAPQAHEAFQAIGTAFAVLSDADKRAHYDRYGDGDGPQGIGGGQGGGPFGRGHHYGAEVSPEDIFNMFFGQPPGARRRQGRGGMPSFNTRVYRAGGGVDRGGGGGNGQEGAMGMNLLPLLGAIVLMFLTLFGGEQQEAAFSLERTSAYKVPKTTTQEKGVVGGIDYFVAPKFRQKYATNAERLRRAKRKRRTMDSEAYDQLILEMETTPLPACEELAVKFSSHSTYN
ncbi:Heat shock protein 40 like protein [Ectocarpus siliculosus]|uniref:Heat shock protein 40 like protein n=1 Tax=Ectocarpus siliculosus TaxID=2880 RepID=D8LBV6_ECTSI|nr:Heat shock protein 40 like protein [Ectocarpus siliculosus]|eukprot:CBN79139.1 Heat shock protein 40 like protein [Ectocarpus siliculosus]